MSRPALKRRILRSLRPAAAAAGVLLLGAVATEIDLVPGETHEVHGAFNFYFRTGEITHRASDAVMPRLIATPSWSATDGLALEDPSLTVEPATMQWHIEGGGQRITYTAQGYRITARARLRVASTAPTGPMQAVVHLPGLALVAAEFGADLAEAADTPSDLLLRRPDTLVVASVIVHSAGGRMLARVRGYIIPTALVLLFVAVWAHQRRRQRAA